MCRPWFTFQNMPIKWYNARHHWYTIVSMNLDRCELLNRAKSMYSRPLSRTLQIPYTQPHCRKGIHCCIFVNVRIKPQPMGKRLLAARHFLHASMNDPYTSLERHLFRCSLQVVATMLKIERYTRNTSNGSLVQYDQMNSTGTSDLLITAATSDSSGDWLVSLIMPVRRLIRG